MRFAFFLVLKHAGSNNKDFNKCQLNICYTFYACSFKTLKCFIYWASQRSKNQDYFLTSASFSVGD